MKRYEYLLLALLFVYGFFLRIYNLGFQSLWIDESFTINASLAILKHFYPLLDSGFVYSGYMFHTYLLAGLFSLFHISAFVARFPSVVFGSLLIPLIYLFARYLFNTRVAIISSVFVSFSTLEIAWSRQARSYILLQLFFYASLFLFLYFIRTKKLRYFYCSLAVAALGYFVHPFSLFLFVVYFVYVLFNFRYFSSVFSKKLFLISIIVILVVGVAFALQLGLFSFVYYLGYYFGFMRSEFFAVFYFGVVGVLFSLKKFREPSLLVIAFVIPFFTVSFFIYLIHFRYIFLVLPVLFIFCAYFIDELSSYAKRFAPLVAIFLVFVVVFSGFTFLPKSGYVLEPLTPQPDFKKAHEYIKENIKPDDVIITSQPAITSFYLRRPDYALDYSLTGKPGDSNSVKGKDYEFYQAVKIVSYDELTDITQNNKGYIIIDSLATNTIKPDMLSLIGGLELVENASSGEGVSLLRVYRF